MRLSRDTCDCSWGSAACSAMLRCMQPFRRRARVQNDYVHPPWLAWEREASQRFLGQGPNIPRVPTAVPDIPCGPLLERSGAAQPPPPQDEAPCAAAHACSVLCQARGHRSTQPPCRSGGRLPGRATHCTPTVPPGAPTWYALSPGSPQARRKARRPGLVSARGPSVAWRRRRGTRWQQGSLALESKAGQERAQQKVLQANGALARSLANCCGCTAWKQIWYKRQQLCTDACMASQVHTRGACADSLARASSSSSTISKQAGRQAPGQLPDEVASSATSSPRLSWSPDDAGLVLPCCCCSLSCCSSKKRRSRRFRLTSSSSAM